MSSLQKSSGKKNVGGGTGRFAGMSNPTFNIMEGHVFSFQKELFQTGSGLKQPGRRFPEAIHDRSSGCSGKSTDSQPVGFDQINASINNRLMVESLDGEGACAPMEQDSDSFDEQDASAKDSLETFLLRKPEPKAVHGFTHKVREVHVDLTKNRPMHTIPEERVSSRGNTHTYSHGSQEAFEEAEALAPQYAAQLEKVSTKKNLAVADFFKKSNKITLNNLQVTQLRQRKPLEQEKTGKSPRAQELKEKPGPPCPSPISKQLETFHSGSRKYLDIASQKNQGSKENPKTIAPSAIRQALNGVHSAKLLEQLKKPSREDPPVPKRDDSLRQNAQLVDDSSEIADMGLFENILGDLKRGSSKKAIPFASEHSTENTSHGRGSSQKLSAGIWPGSKDSSKTHIRVNVGNLAKKVNFNIDNCFK
jgi:hypothetical protein